MPEVARPIIQCGLSKNYEWKNIKGWWSKTSVQNNFVSVDHENMRKPLSVSHRPIDHTNQHNMAPLGRASQQLQIKKNLCSIFLTHFVVTGCLKHVEVLCYQIFHRCVLQFPWDFYFYWYVNIVYILAN